MLFIFYFLRSLPYEFLVRTTDKRPPSFMKGTPIIQAVGYTSFDILLRMSEAGTMFFAITGEMDPEPTLLELVNGTREASSGRRLSAKVTAHHTMGYLINCILGLKIVYL